MSSPARFKARIARTGPQTYPEGVQHRSAADVFHPDSLAGLAGLRVQIGHGTAPQVGRVVPGTVRRDGDGTHVVATLELTDANAVAGIRTGHIREISLAYTCELATDAYGRTQQTNIRYDGPGAHVALLDIRRDRARCGESCSIQQDSTNMTRVTRVSDATPLDCGCSTTNTDASDERAAIAGWLNECTRNTGVPAADILMHHDANLDVTPATIAAAAARAVASSDQAFRAHLAAQPAADDRGTRAATTDAAVDLNDDNSFSAHLARLAGAK